MPTQKYRRPSEEIYAVYKYMHGTHKVDRTNLLPLLNISSATTTREQSFKHKKHTSRDPALDKVFQHASHGNLEKFPRGHCICDKYRVFQGITGPSLEKLQVSDKHRCYWQTDKEVAEARATDNGSTLAQCQSPKMM